MKRATPPKRKKPLKRSTKRIKVRRVSKRFAKRRNPKFLAWVRTLPCTVKSPRTTCWLTWDLLVDPAHVTKTRAAGADDVGCVAPLCRAHHSESHQIGIKSFEAKYGLDLRSLAQQVAQQWMESQG